MGICGAREGNPWGTGMRLLLSTSRRQIQILLAAGLIAATAAVAGPAVAAPTPQGCIGSSCNGLNSNTAGCVSDAVSRSAPQTFSDTAADEQLAIQLRGSPSCESRWARVWAFNSSGSQWAGQAVRVQHRLHAVLELPLPGCPRRCPAPGGDLQPAARPGERRGLARRPPPARSTGVASSLLP